MQAHTQLSGQVGGAQLSGVTQQNLPLQGVARRRTWQTNADVGMRRMIVERILQVCQRNRNYVASGMQQKLPDFVKRLEEALYREASSKEEYCDLSTLERRLQAVGKRIGPIRANPNVAARGMNVASSSMIPTPGVPTMIPTPGHEAATTVVSGSGASNCNFSGTNNAMVSPGSISSMIPTPGLSTPLPAMQGNGQNGQGVQNTSRASNQMNGGLDAEKTGLPHNSGLNGRTNGNVNGTLPSNIQWGCVNGTQGHGLQPMSNGQQQFSNANLSYSNPSLHMNSGGYGNISVLSQQQQMTQLRHQHMHGDRFATDATGTGAFYNAMSTSMGMHCHGSSKMIPVPGLPAQQSNTQSQQQPQLQAKVSVSLKEQQQLPNGKALSDNYQQASLVSQEDGNQVSPSSTFNSLIDGGQSHPSQRASKELHQQQSHPSAGLRHQQQMAQHGATGAQPLRCQVGQNQQQESSHQHNRPQVSSSEPPRHVFSLDDVGEPLVSRQEAANGCLPESQGGACCNANASSIPEQQRAQQYLRQQRWLMFLRHASKCVAPEGQCQQTPHCHTAKQLWTHIFKCKIRDCQYPRCVPSRTLLKHHQTCKDPDCPVCVPVRQGSRMQVGQGQAAQATSSTSSGKANIIGTLPGSMHGQVQLNRIQTFPTMTSDMEQPPAKRAKLEVSEQNPLSHNMVSDSQTMASAVSTEGHTVSVKVEEGGLCIGIKLDGHDHPTNNPTLHIEARVKLEDSFKSEDKLKVEVAQPAVMNCEHSSTVASKSSVQVKQEVKEEIVANSCSVGTDHVGNTKACKSKNKGVSLIELFTPEQIREHITGLRQWVGQNKARVEKNQAMEHQMNENSCQLCAVETLTFEPPPIYCTPCGARIKRNFVYWTMQCGETRHYFCAPCHNDSKSDSVMVDGHSYLKSRLEKRRNDEETEEPWVQCDKCEKWQHQICALFNMRRNEGGQAEYTCPNCLLIEMGKGERMPLPQSAVLGAKDLPKTFLSDHIEHRLARRLKQERLERARGQGKGYNEVPGADSLVVRVVSSVDKRLEVKPHFLQIFQEEDYPAEFPYKSKVLLLFQKIEGVEVCLFGMYVQEFGADAAQPNERRVYLSYLDSVKYFRPEVRTVNGEALRTFVYHEILIGYLDYCKTRGFTSCYIWACPPLKGEDYILYCHPEIQKTPKSDKLRDWYLAMLFKAANEGIVAEVTNMYDHFFVCTGETKAKVTAARLPYFDGDYWPGAAEEMIMLLQEEETGRRPHKKGKTKGATKRATKTAAQAELAINASKDLQLMHKLGESIYPMKEDFIMVHMQFACTHCCNFILSGCRWTCRVCKHFNICERCYAEEQKLDEWARHPMNNKEAHQLFPITTEPLPDATDKDEIMESEFFDTRQAFLSLCQGNHYQYDTLRRAKNSSMMVLYHLHNPTAPAYVTTCNICHRDIETGQGWRCETCPDFDICNPCYSKDNSIKHPHALVPHPSAAERDAQSKEARQQRVVQLRKMLELLVHASQCGSAQQCQYPNCRRVKALFRHGFSCRTRASGGCQLCKRMWYLLQLHSRACKEAECRVPRCKDLKEHLRRLQQQQESRRRAAVMEMMRQRTAGSTA